MARVRVLKRQDKAYIELPQDLSGEDEVEFFQLKEGFYLLTIPLGEHSKQEISESEKSVLRKLLSIRFENRTPPYVVKTLSEGEMPVLRDLEKKGLVNVFKGSKYKDGVYNINDKVYKLLAQQKTQQPLQPPSAPQTAPGTLSVLNSKGFIIVADKREAMSLSEQLSQEMKSGSIVGVKGFDGKFYIVTRDYYMKAMALIAKVLNEDMDAPKIASATKLDPDGCLAVLRLMAENGEIIEKKRGIFAPV